MDSVSHLINAAMEFGSVLMAVMNGIAVSLCLQSCSNQGFKWGGGGWNPPPLSADILKSSMIIIVVPSLFGKFVPDCIRSNLRGSKFKSFLGVMSPDPPSSHACLRMLLSSCQHPVPPNSKSCINFCEPLNQQDPTLLLLSIPELHECIQRMQLLKQLMHTYKQELVKVNVLVQTHELMYDNILQTTCNVRLALIGSPR